MDYRILKVAAADGVATATISRPEALNALNTRFFNEMDVLIDEIADRDDVRVLILTGEGKAFVAGADIGEMVGMTQLQATEFSEMGQSTFRGLELLDKPVIAAVNGFALGGGCELAMACDIRIASTKAKFGQPEVNLGLIPGYAGTQRLPRLVGLGNALRLLMTAEAIGADEALRIGLVQRVVEPEQLLPAPWRWPSSSPPKAPKPSSWSSASSGRDRSSTSSRAASWSRRNSGPCSRARARKA